MTIAVNPTEYAGCCAVHFQLFSDILLASGFSDILLAGGGLITQVINPSASL